MFTVICISPGNPCPHFLFPQTDSYHGVVTYMSRVDSEHLRLGSKLNQAMPFGGRGGGELRGKRRSFLVKSHVSLMGKNYVICTLGYSWDRIMCFHCNLA